MSDADWRIEIATELALDAKDNLANLQHKLSAVEAAKLEIEARLKRCTGAPQQVRVDAAKAISNAPLTGKTRK
jgi:hypothetical protein